MELEEMKAKLDMALLHLYEEQTENKKADTDPIRAKMRKIDAELLWIQLTATIAVSLTVFFCVWLVLHTRG